MNMDWNRPELRRIPDRPLHPRLDSPCMQKTNRRVDRITIKKIEYDSLLQLRSEYASLRSALIAGGVPQENLSLLIGKDNTATTSCGYERDVSEPFSEQGWSPSATVFVPKSHAHNDWHTTQSLLDSPQTTSFATDDFMPPSTEHDNAVLFDHGSEQVRFEDNHEDRSLVFRGLPQHAALADILPHVRGGLVLHSFISNYHKSAHITFVSALAAEKYLIYAKRSDLYLGGKRIEVFWDDKQRMLSGYLARRIAQENASRNLVLRFVKPHMTAESIREDLEHIYHLEVVNMNFSGGHCFISLNSVSLACTAKSCMQSRQKYKGVRIEFYPDECGQPLPDVPPRTRNKASKPDLPSKGATMPSRRRRGPNVNRFEALAGFDSEGLDDGGDGVPLGDVRRSISSDQAWA